MSTNVLCGLFIVDSDVMQQKFKAIKVRVMLVEESLYQGGVVVNVLKFTEYATDMTMGSRYELSSPTNAKSNAEKAVAAAGYFK